MTISIKKCEYKDVYILQEIGIETFNDTFKDQNSPDHESDMKAGEHAGMMSLPIETAIEQNVLDSIRSTNTPLKF